MTEESATRPPSSLPPIHGHGRRTRLLPALAAGAAAIVLVGAGLAVRLTSPAPIRIGAVFPISGNAEALARPELTGVQIAIDQANADGGIGGRRIELVVRDLESRAAADGIMAEFASDGIRLVIGAYSSDLSVAASAAADRAGIVYWESGAVADRLTGRGLPQVFRVGASGANLGSNSATFVASQLADRLGKPVRDVRVAIVNANDDYARSVADAAATTATAAGLDVVSRTGYDLGLPRWSALMAALAAAKPDAIILASHIPDGVQFRQEMLKAGLRVGALIGSTMAECDPDFAGELGADAIGIFASDRPTAGFRPAALSPEARVAYERFATTWAAAARAGTGASAGASANSSGEYGKNGAYRSGDGYGNGGEYRSPEYPISGPAESPTAEASEEALAGYSAAWALVRHVLPAALGDGSSFDAAALAAAARSVDLPDGALPNGAGLRFSSDPATLGQNERAAAVIWQWQAVRQYAFVWPASYATGDIAFVPLGR